MSKRRRRRSNYSDGRVAVRHADGSITYRKKAKRRRNPVNPLGDVLLLVGLGGIVVGTGYYLWQKSQANAPAQLGAAAATQQSSQEASAAGAAQAASEAAAFNAANGTSSTPAPATDTSTDPATVASNAVAAGQAAAASFF